jgi:hypothetical protein
MENQELKAQVGAGFNEEKLEFFRQVFAQSLLFMKKDNEVLGHLSSFTASFAQHIENNPDFIIRFMASRKSNLDASGVGSPEVRMDWDDVQHVIDAITQIVNLIREDKKFFASLLAGIFGWDYKP